MLRAPPNTLRVQALGGEFQRFYPPRARSGGGVVDQRLRRSPQRGEEAGPGDFRVCGFGCYGAGVGSPYLQSLRLFRYPLLSTCGDPSPIFSARKGVIPNPQHGVAPRLPQSAHTGAIALAIAVRGSNRASRVFRHPFLSTCRLPPSAHTGVAA